MSNRINPDVETYVPDQKVGGFDMASFKDNHFIFFTNKKIKPRLSFLIYDISIIDKQEILKIIFKKQKVICRVMKISKNGIASTIIDLRTVDGVLIDTPKQYFYSGQGISIFLYDNSYITQWEVPVLDLLFRAYAIGDSQAFTTIIEKYQIELEDTAKEFIKYELD